MKDTMLAAVVTPERTLEVRSVPVPQFGPYEALVVLAPPAPVRISASSTMAIRARCATQAFLAMKASGGSSPWAKK